jgi:hypothetical protein
MKRFLYLAAATIAICLVAPATYAQGNSLRLRFHVPFPFITEGSSFPAGEYEVTMPTRMNLALRNLKGQATLFVNALPASSEEADGLGKVVFHRYGNEYFLSLVSTGSWLSTYRIRMSKEERRIADASPRPQLKVASVLINGTVQTANADQK